MTTPSRASLDTEQVVEAAVVLADAEGLDAITLTRVADELGVKQPALYRHVDNFDALVRFLGLRGREILLARLTDAVVGVSGDDAVRSLGRAWRDMARDHPGVYAATDRYPCAGDPELEAAVEAVVEVIAQSLVSFDLSAEQTVVVARSLRSAFHGFAHLEAGDGHPHPMDLDDSFDQLVDLLIAGTKSLSSAL